MAGTKLGIFLAVEPCFLPTARRELFLGLEERGNLAELPIESWNDPVAIVEKASALGAQVIIFMAGFHSPLGRRLSQLAKENHLSVGFVYPTARMDLSGFAGRFRSAQSDILTALRHPKEPI